MFNTTKALFQALVITSLIGAISAHAVDITGAGSTFVYPVLSKWSATYATKTGNRVNYQSIGSGGGIAQIKAATVDFGASDAPLSEDDLNKAGLGQFPVVIGGIVPVVHVEGVKPGELKLTGPLLGDIFLGKVTKWNDAAIVQINPGITLPDAMITVVHRSDGSGTTYNFSNYLAKINPQWKEKVSFGTSVPWPVGIGGKGNEGVSAFVNQTKNAIGYVEYAYALQNKMTYTQMQNAAGKFLRPTAGAFAAAAATADWQSAKDFNLIMTNAPGPDAWPITATTWAILYKTARNVEHAKATFEFFRWSFEHGQQQAESLDYVPLPKPLVDRIETYWKTDFKG